MRVPRARADRCAARAAQRDADLEARRYELTAEREACTGLTFVCLSRAKCIVYLLIGPMPALQTARLLWRGRIALEVRRIANNTAVRRSTGWLGVIAHRLAVGRAVQRWSLGWCVVVGCFVQNFQSNISRQRWPCVAECSQRILGIYNISQNSIDLLTAVTLFYTGTGMTAHTSRKLLLLEFLSTETTNNTEYSSHCVRSGAVV